MIQPYIPRASIFTMLILTLPACGDGSAGGGADELTRSTFIDAYVDLRVAALRTEDGQITDGARDEILERHGVTEEDLVDFVTATGDDFEFMRDLWNEIELRLDSVPPLEREPASPDSAGTSAPADPTMADPPGDSADASARARAS